MAQARQVRGPESQADESLGRSVAADSFPRTVADESQGQLGEADSCLRRAGEGCPDSGLPAVVDLAAEAAATAAVAEAGSEEDTDQAQAGSYQHKGEAAGSAVPLRGDTGMEACR